VEPAVFEEAMAAIESGEPKYLTYGISDDEAFGVGLTCGGIIHIFVERVDW
jgi:xanthine dehydrogenase accessory factor